MMRKQLSEESTYMTHDPVTGTTPRDDNCTVWHTYGICGDSMQQIRKTSKRPRFSDNKDLFIIKLKVIEPVQWQQYLATGEVVSP